MDVCELLLLMRSLSHRLALECFRLASGALGCSALLFGCSTTGPASSSVAPAPAPATAGHTEAANDKMQVRNNASSLLAQLLDQEKNVSKVLIIKHGSRELSGLIQALNYGSRLAKVAADNSADPGEADAFLTMSRTLDRLLTQVKAMMRSLPSK